VANVHVPFLFKQAADALTSGAAAVPLWGVAALTPSALLVGYGLARGGAALCNGAWRRLLALHVRTAADAPPHAQSCATRCLPRLHTARSARWAGASSATCTRWT
jgi:hypothetical protein